MQIIANLEAPATELQNRYSDPRSKVHSHWQLAVYPYGMASRTFWRANLATMWMLQSTSGWRCFTQTPSLDLMTLTVRLSQPRPADPRVGAVDRWTCKLIRFQLRNLQWGDCAAVNPDLSRVFHEIPLHLDIFGRSLRCFASHVGRSHSICAAEVMCGISALALKTNAPTILREEALTYADAKGATVFGSSVPWAKSVWVWTVTCKCMNGMNMYEWIWVDIWLIY